MSKNPYKVLGIDENAEFIVIQAAYRAMANKYHPDKWQGDKKEAEEKIREINNAYSFLTDKKYKNEFDYKNSSNQSLSTKAIDFKSIFQTLITILIYVILFIVIESFLFGPSLFENWVYELLIISTLCFIFHWKRLIVFFICVHPIIFFINFIIFSNYSISPFKMIRDFIYYITYS